MFRDVILTLVVAVIGLSACRTVEEPDPPLPESVTWMQLYYRERDASQISQRITDMEASGILREQRYRSFISAFFAQIFIENPDQLQEWFEEIQKLPPVSQGIFVVALRWADTPQTRMMLATREKSLDDNISSLIRTLRTLPIPDFSRVPVRAAEDLDCCWASFFAGAAEPFVLAVVKTAVMPEQHGTVNRLAYEARVSLRNWMERDPVVVQLVEDFARTASPREQSILYTLASEQVGMPDKRFTQELPNVEYE